MSTPRLTLEEATPDTFSQLVEEAGPDVLVVVDFYGPNCPNCEVFAAHAPRLLEALAEEPVRVVKCDAYAYPELARRFALHGVPTFVLFHDGKKLGKMSQYRGADFWLTVVREHLPEKKQEITQI